MINKKNKKICVRLSSLRHIFKKYAKEIKKKKQKKNYNEIIYLLDLTN